MDTDDLPEVILTIVLVGIILFVGTYTVSGVIDSTGTDATDAKQQAALLDGTTWTTLGDTVGVKETVYDSRGYAVKLSGSDNSYIESSQDIEIASDDTWTLSVWASRDDATTSTQTVFSADGRVIVTYNGSTSNWSAWYYDDGSRNSYEVSVGATSQSGELENIVVIRDGSTLSLYANDTNSNSISVTGNNIEPAPVNSTNWDGRLEELRLSDTAWNSSVRTTHYNNPIDPLPVTETGRVMFDEPYKDSQLLFYADGEITTSNVQFAQGLPGQQLKSGDVLLEQSDYGWRQDGPQIRAIDGGELDGAPVAYVDYKTKGIVANLVGDWNQAMGLAALLLILLPLGTILVYLKTAQDAR